MAHIMQSVSLLVVCLQRWESAGRWVGSSCHRRAAGSEQPIDHVGDSVLGGACEQLLYQVQNLAHEL